MKRPEPSAFPLTSFQTFQKMSLAPESRDGRSHQSPRPNLQDVLVVMGSHSLDRSDSDDSDEEEPREVSAHRREQRNCAFYNTKTSTHSPGPPPPPSADTKPLEECWSKEAEQGAAGWMKALQTAILDPLEPSGCDSRPPVSSGQPFQTLWSL